MSRDKCQAKTTRLQDMSWEVAIRDAESEICQAKDGIKKLSASIRYLKEQKKNNTPFPLGAGKRTATHN